jgi:hypothetical protein
MGFWCVRVYIDQKGNYSLSRAICMKWFESKSAKEIVGIT